MKREEGRICFRLNNAGRYGVVAEVQHEGADGVRFGRCQIPGGDAVELKVGTTGAYSHGDVGIGLSVVGRTGVGEFRGLGVVERVASTEEKNALVGLDVGTRAVGAHEAEGAIGALHLGKVIADGDIAEHGIFNIVVRFSPLDDVGHPS